jgi:N-acetylglucosamine kinase-like BadF-type ATPase
MILIAEGGSTKADWILLNNDFEEMEKFRTIGLNPYFHTKEDVKQALSNSREIQSYRFDVEEVFFYGAGCSSPKLNKRILEGLQEVFPHARSVVEHDLLAAAFATYTGEPEIACIVGTGSNSCFFDGEEIREEAPALAYVLGDEASGSYIGKRLIRDFFYKKLPIDLNEDFKNEYGLSKDEVVERVYNRPHANVYLANFAYFAGKHKDHNYIRSIVKEGFRQFIEFHVLCFPEASKVKVNFVGSIASVFRSDLELVMNEFELKMGEIVGRPVDGLIRYHKNYKHKFSRD